MPDRPQDRGPTDHDDELLKLVLERAEHHARIAARTRPWLDVENVAYEATFRVWYRMATGRLVYDPKRSSKKTFAHPVARWAVLTIVKREDNGPGRWDSFSEPVGPQDPSGDGGRTREDMLWDNEEPSVPVQVIRAIESKEAKDLLARMRAWGARALPRKQAVAFELFLIHEGRTAEAMTFAGLVGVDRTNFANNLRHALAKARLEFGR